MLVLTRKVGEEVFIDVGDQRIVVKVVEFKGSGVRLAFEADRSIKIMRRELIEKVVVMT